MSVCLIKLPCTQASSPISSGDVLLLDKKKFMIVNSGQVVQNCWNQIDPVEIFNCFLARMNVSSCDDMNKNSYDWQRRGRTFSRSSAHHRDESWNVLLLSLSYTRRLCSKQNSPERLEVLREKPSVYICFWRPCPPSFSLSPVNFWLMLVIRQLTLQLPLSISHICIEKKRKHRCIRSDAHTRRTYGVTAHSHLAPHASGRRHMVHADNTSKQKSLGCLMMGLL